MVFLFRKNGGQVTGASVDGAAYTSADTTYFGTVTDPPTPNGTDLSLPKIWDLTNLRTATGPEQTAFVTAAAADANLQARAGAIGRLQTDVILRKILRAIVGLTVQQLNAMAPHIDTTASPASHIATITEAGAETAIVNAINAGTWD
jgi:hypothetical protein